MVVCHRGKSVATAALLLAALGVLGWAARRRRA
jgi:hypothetical protein